MVEQQANVSTSDVLDNQYGLFCHRFALPIIFVYLLLLCLSVSFLKHHIAFNTDTTDMISEELDWRKDSILLRKAFPGISDNIIIRLKGENANLTRLAKIALLDELKNSEFIHSVYAPLSDPFIEKHRLYYLSDEQLSDIVPYAALLNQTLLSVENSGPLGGLINIISAALDKNENHINALEKAWVSELTKTIEYADKDLPYAFSWMDGFESKTKSQYIVVLPKLSYADVLPGKAALDDIRASINELGLVEKYGVEAALTGKVALSYDELMSAGEGTLLATAIALFVVAMVLFVALKSVYLVAAALLTLVVGLTITGATAIAVVGEFNLISIAFAVLYIGLGIDFSIHMGTRFIELKRSGFSKISAVMALPKLMGRSLLICAVTTSIAFFSFMPTSFKGVADLGVIAGLGMLICYAVTISLFPALLRFAPANLNVPKIKKTKLANFAKTMEGLSAWSVAVAVVLTLAALLIALDVRFESDPMALRSPHSESVVAFNDMLSDGEFSPRTISIVIDDSQEAVELTRQLAALDSVGAVRSIQSIVPNHQAEKAVAIESLLTRLNQISPQTSLGTKSVTLDALYNQLETIITTGEGNSLATTQLLNALHSLLLSESGVNELTSRASLGFNDALTQTSQLLSAQPFSKDDLPNHLKSLWLTPDGQERIEVSPKYDITESRYANEFVQQVTAISPNATGYPVIYQKAGDVVVSAFTQAFGIAFCAIALVLFVLVRRLSDICIVIIPLLMVSVFTGAASVMFGVPFNFANIIALPLLLGVGVDTGIHLVHRYRAEKSRSKPLLLTSTAQAVVVSSLTTLFSFVSLSFSAHVGTSGMGLILAIGMMFTLLISLWVTPALLSICSTAPKESV